MQKSLSILLLVALTLQVFSGWEVLAGFRIHQKYIAKVLCVNRDNPEMHCNGKCYLKKELQKEHHQKSGENGTIGNRMDITLFCSTEQFLYMPDVQIVMHFFTPVKYGDYSSPHSSPFHPPRLIG